MVADHVAEGGREERHKRSLQHKSLYQRGAGVNEDESLSEDEKIKSETSPSSSLLYLQTRRHRRLLKTFIAY